TLTEAFDFVPWHTCARRLPSGASHNPVLQLPATDPHAPHRDRRLGQRRTVKPGCLGLSQRPAYDQPPGPARREAVPEPSEVSGLEPVVTRIGAAARTQEADLIQVEERSVLAGEP